MIVSQSEGYRVTGSRDGDHQNYPTSECEPVPFSITRG